MDTHAKQVFAYTAPTNPHGSTPYLQIFQTEGQSEQRITMRDATGFIASTTIPLSARIDMSRALLSQHRISELPAAERVAYAQALLEGTDYEVQIKPQSKEDRIKRMVDRFLQWRLPADFNPDGGISYKPFINQSTKQPYEGVPVGTNLFTATQATAMVGFMLEGL